jgi:signal transduction histidine kinase/FixJ family two-component response regulator
MPPRTSPLPPARRKARILIVEDDEDNLFALAHAMGEVAEVVTAASGQDALEAVLDGDFAVILLDVSMPDMDGYEVAALIRERDRTARIPVIFLSTMDEDAEHRMRGYALGAVDYLLKPVDLMMLKSKVSVFVDLFDMRVQIEAKNRAEQQLRDANHAAELEKLRVLGELQASHARQAAILNVMPLALFEAQEDENGGLVRRLVGGNLSRIVGEVDASAIERGALGLEENILEEDRKALAALPMADRRDNLTNEYRWRESSGVLHHFIEQCVPAEAAADGARRWACTLVDVTERKQLEARLVQAGKMDAIGKLTGGVAHDFNNLLAVILGGITLLEKRIAFSERDRTIVDQMRQIANKGAELVQRMLAFARKQDLTPVSVSPVSVHRSIAGLIEQTLGGMVTIEWGGAPTERNFFADRSQLELTLINLIINARDAMPGGGTISIDMGDAPREAVLHAGLPSGAYLRVAVSDHGIGIPPALLDKITDPFFTTKEVGKGTGLGLSMVMGFVQQSGGRLTIRSQLDEGTTVEILLPSTDLPEAASASAAVGDPASEPVVRTILLVDDDHAVRRVISEQLRDMGVDVSEASGGEEALDILARAPDCFDLILTDFAMPTLNGLQTINEARKLCPGLRARIMTGYAAEGLEEIAGSIEVFHKPLSMADLRRVLDDRQVEAASAG